MPACARLNHTPGTEMGSRRKRKSREQGTGNRTADPSWNSGLGTSLATLRDKRDSQNRSTPAGLMPSVGAWFRRLKPAAIHGKPLRGSKAQETRARDGGTWGQANSRSLVASLLPSLRFPRYARDKRGRRGKPLDYARDRRDDTAGWRHRKSSPGTLSAVPGCA